MKETSPHYCLYDQGLVNDIGAEGYIPLVFCFDHKDHLTMVGQARFEMPRPVPSFFGFHKWPSITVCQTFWPTQIFLEAVVNTDRGTISPLADGSCQRVKLKYNTYRWGSFQTPMPPEGTSDASTLARAGPDASKSVNCCSFILLGGVVLSRQNIDQENKKVSFPIILSNIFT